MTRILIFGLLLAVPGLLRAHTVVFVGGRLVLRPDRAIELRLEIRTERLPLFAQTPEGSFASVGDIRANEIKLTDCFLKSLSVVRGTSRITPVEVRWPLLRHEGAPVADSVALPEAVPLVVRWAEGVSFTASQVVDDFELPETLVQLVVQEDPARPPAGTTMVPGDESWWRTVGRSLIVGFRHIVPEGLDHILFVLGLYFCVRRVRDLVWQVTMFTIAHSITLGLAMSGVVVLGAFWAPLVEIGIALSIVAVTVENCLTDKSPGVRRYAIIGTFGLIHGLGFAGALSEVNWPASRFLTALVSANLGIELGQLVVVAGAMLATGWLWPREWYRRRVTIPASVAIGLCGLWWAGERALGLLAHS